MTDFTWQQFLKVINNSIFVSNHNGTPSIPVPSENNDSITVERIVFPESQNKTVFIYKTMIHIHDKDGYLHFFQLYTPYTYAEDVLSKIEKGE